MKQNAMKEPMWVAWKTWMEKKSEENQAARLLSVEVLVFIERHLDVFSKIAVVNWHGKMTETVHMYRLGPQGSSGLGRYFFWEGRVYVELGESLQSDHGATLVEALRPKDFYAWCNDSKTVIDLMSHVTSHRAQQ